MKSILFFSIAFGIFSFNRLAAQDSVKRNVIYHTADNYFFTISNNKSPGFGNFSFQEHHAIDTDSLPLGVSFLGSFWDHSKRTNIPIDAEVRIGEIQVPKTGELVYDYHLEPVNSANNPYGRKIPFRVNVLTAPGFSVSDSVYIPTRIKLKYPDYVIMGVSQNEIIEATDLSVGQVIYWNADKLNSSGVCLLIEYLPNEVGNGSISRKNKKSAFNWIVLDDTGSYKMEAGLFKNVPKNARISLTISRGNYVALNDMLQGDKSILLTAYSTQQLSFRYSGE